MAVDYLSALNVGSGLNVTQIVDAIVDAERVPQENVIQRKIDEKTVSVSALGQLKGNFASLDKNLEGMDGKTGLVTSSSSTAVTVEETGTFAVEPFEHELNILTNSKKSYSFIFWLHFCSVDIKHREHSIRIWGMEYCSRYFHFKQRPRCSNR